MTEITTIAVRVLWHYTWTLSKGSEWTPARNWKQLLSFDRNICDEWNGCLMEKRETYGSAFCRVLCQSGSSMGSPWERAAQWVAHRINYTVMACPSVPVWGNASVVMSHWLCNVCHFPYDFPWYYCCLYPCTYLSLSILSLLLHFEYFIFQFHLSYLKPF